MKEKWTFKAFNCSKRELIGFVFLSLGIGFLPIIKIFLLPGCKAFDVTDDANHTFVNLFIARANIQVGQFPLINLWNNFGTPLLGDVLSYPWSLHAQTYWFFSPVMAMTINRFFLSALTTFFLIIYFRRLMSEFSACVCAVLVFLTPGFFWHFAHHHYQAAQLCFVLVLLAQRKFVNDKKCSSFFLLCLSFIFLFVNSSIHTACIMLPLFVMNQALLVEGRSREKLMALFLAMLSGIIFVLPDLMNFAYLISESMRVQMGYNLAPHLTVAKRFSIPMLGFVLWGCLMFWREGKKGLSDLLRVLILGLVPMVFIFILLNAHTFWQKIPLVKSTDISRLWWFSNVFLVIGVGKSLDTIRNRSAYTSWLVLYGYLLLVVELCFRAFLKHTFLYDQKYMIFFFVLSILGFLVIYLLKKKDRSKQASFVLNWKVHFWIIGSAIIGLQIFCVSTRIMELQNQSVCRTGFYFSEKGDDVFRRRSFLDHIPTNSRIAVDDVSQHGRDIKINRDFVFGSTGRSVILNREFSEFLLKEELITPDNVPFAYHFSPPWKEESLATLGIRFVMQKGYDHKLIQKGWRLAASDDEWHLYENPLKTSLVYLVDDTEKRVPLDSAHMEIRGNGLTVQLPKLNVRYKEMVATFIHIRGWTARVDGEIRKISHNKNMLLRIPLKEGDNFVVLKYEPFSLHIFILCALIAFLIPLVCFRFLFKGD